MKIDDKHHENGPKPIPYNSDREYKYTGWKGWGDFLGTGNISQRQDFYKPLENLLISIFFIEKYQMPRMPRRGRKEYEEGSYQKRSYQTKDNTKLKITNYIFSKGDIGTIKNDIMHNANLPTQQWNNLGEILNELVDLNWITRSLVSKTINHYKITETGREVINETKKILEENNNPLKNLDTFKGISVPFQSKFT